MNDVSTFYIYINFTDDGDILSSRNYFFYQEIDTENSKVNVDKLLYWIYND